MTKSKNKPGNATRSTATGPLVALHQDQIMEAFARGFVYTDGKQLKGQSIVTREALNRAMGGEAWGSVVLLEMRSSPDYERSEDIAVQQPLLLTDCIACWAPSEDVAGEIEARLQTFDDTMPTALELKVNESLFPGEVDDPLPVKQATESLALPFADPLAVISQGKFIANAADAADTGANALFSSALEKTAGAIALARWRCVQQRRPAEFVRDLIAVEGPGSGLDRFARHVYATVRASEAITDDCRIFASAASMLQGLTPKDGFEPVRFARDLDGKMQADGSGLPTPSDLKAFVETIQKVIDNRIELSESKIDDSGRIGQRALMLFLLAPRAEELERWIGARSEVGKDVALLASVLSGLYCGLGGIPRGMKGPDPSPFFAAVDAANSIAVGAIPILTLSRHWDESASLRETLSVSGHALMGRTELPAPILAEVLAKARSLGRRVEVNPDSGEIKVALEVGQAWPMGTMAIGPSAYRLPAFEVLQLLFKVKSGKKGQLPRQLLEELLSGSISPVAARITPANGIELRVEMDPAEDAGLGLEALAATARHLELVPAEDRKPVAQAKGPPKKRAPSTRAKQGVTAPAVGE